MKKILFTGAGFTKNFNGLLADQIWAKLLTLCSSRSEKLRIKFLEYGRSDDYNYEKVYEKMFKDESIDSNDKKILTDILTEIYDGFGSRPINMWQTGYGIKKLIAKFSGKKRDPGLFFTLNQDLFIENFFNPEDIYPMPERLGINFTKNQENSYETQVISEQSAYRQKAEEHLKCTDFAYVKLHGSVDWRDKNGRIMIIGSKKEEQLNDYPLLQYYKQKFEESIYKDECKLLIIGYGFQDAYINELLAKGVEEYKLQIHVISPQRSQDFMGQVLGAKCGDKISKGIYGYYECTLAEMFPPELRARDTPYYTALMKSFFGDK